MLYPRGTGLSVNTGMVNRITRCIVAVWLSIALVGQTLGYVSVSCPGVRNVGIETSPGPGDQSLAGMAAMDHSHHAQPAISAESAPMDCCGDANCPMLHCVASPSLSVANDLKSPVDAARVDWPDFLLSHSSSPPDSLYRPPTRR
jgi:hypothetical protein